VVVDLGFGLNSIRKTAKTRMMEIRGLILNSSVHGCMTK